MPRREYRNWTSPHLGREMELLVFGHAGARLLVFPTSMGRFFEWEDRGMFEALGEHLERGWIQAFCVDSHDAHTWYDETIHPAERARRHEAYERYVLGEVLPFSLDRNPEPFVIAAGASFGAYHAVNLALRHPTRFGRVIGMSGLYDIKRLTGGYEDEAVFAHDPSHYMVRLSDPGHLEALRRMDIILATGRDDAHRENNEHLARTLASKNVDHALRIWDGWAHDWPWWREMIVRYVGGAG